MPDHTHHPQRARTAAAWIAWHATELAALTVPVVLALTVTPWLWLLVLAVAAAWVAHEVREQRHDHHTRHESPALTTGHDQAALASTETETTPADEGDAHTEETRHG